MDNSLIGKKTLGQHWLNNEDSLNQIIAAIEINDSDIVLEIGPGLGSLTSKLVKLAKKVVAVELDPEASKRLLWNVPAPNLEIINANILDYDLGQLPSDYKVVANIPYYLTAKLLRRLSESANPFLCAAILVQKEVAQRVAASPGKMSLLSVSVQYYSQTKLGGIITADKFSPPPKIDSQVIILKRHSKPLYPELDSKQFFKVVKAGFSQRRKTLLNSLSGGLAMERDEVQTRIKKAGLVPSARPQTLSLDEWRKLATTFI